MYSMTEGAREMHRNVPREHDDDRAAEESRSSRSPCVLSTAAAHDDTRRGGDDGDESHAKQSNTSLRLARRDPRSSTGACLQVNGIFAYPALSWYGVPRLVAMWRASALCDAGTVTDCQLIVLDGQTWARHITTSAHTRRHNAATSTRHILHHQPRLHRHRLHCH